LGVSIFKFIEKHGAKAKYLDDLDYDVSIDKLTNDPNITRYVDRNKTRGIINLQEFSHLLLKELVKIRNELGDVMKMDYVCCDDGAITPKLFNSRSSALNLSLKNTRQRQINYILNFNSFKDVVPSVLEQADTFILFRIKQIKVKGKQTLPDLLLDQEDEIKKLEPYEYIIFNKHDETIDYPTD
jgi:hypothetical protein